MTDRTVRRAADELVEHGMVRRRRSERSIAWKIGPVSGDSLSTPEDASPDTCDTKWLGERKTVSGQDGHECPVTDVTGHTCHSSTENGVRSANPEALIEKQQLDNYSTQRQNSAAVSYDLDRVRKLEEMAKSAGVKSPETRTAIAATASTEGERLGRSSDEIHAVVHHVARAVASGTIRNPGGFTRSVIQNPDSVATAVVAFQQAIAQAKRNAEYAARRAQQDQTAPKPRPSDGVRSSPWYDRAKRKAAE
ncbi:MAG: hypothetical protein AAGI17_01995 [Planctomycetota bacterium]